MAYFEMLITIEGQEDVWKAKENEIRRSSKDFIPTVYLFHDLGNDTLAVCPEDEPMYQEVLRPSSPQATILGLVL